mmetsp:Transcript_27659/g.71767  ORF Transcript_27659/g.71767 Transcript_27659/m.71767 type:complete len:700 (+) Transcript_27659:232-2331(+)
MGLRVPAMLTAVVALLVAMNAVPAGGQLGRSSQLCQVLVAIPCGLTSVPGHPLTPDPASHPGLPVYCNPTCQERIQFPQCGDTYASYSQSCATLACLATLSSACGLPATVGALDTSFRQAPEDWTYPAELACSEACGKALLAGECAQLSSSNGFSRMDDYRETLGADGAFCRKHRCEAALREGCAGMDTAQLTLDDFCARDACMAALGSSDCSTSAPLGFSTDAAESHCVDMACISVAAAACLLEDGSMDAALLCSAECTAALAGGCSDPLRLAAHQQLVCSAEATDECAKALRSACPLGPLLLSSHPEDICTFKCAAAASAPPCSAVDTHPVAWLIRNTCTPALEEAAPAHANEAELGEQSCKSEDLKAVCNGEAGGAALRYSTVPDLLQYSRLTTPTCCVALRRTPRCGSSEHRDALVASMLQETSAAMVTVVQLASNYVDALCECRELMLAGCARRDEDPTDELWAALGVPLAAGAPADPLCMAAAKSEACRAASRRATLGADEGQGMLDLLTQLYRERNPPPPDEAAGGAGDGVRESVVEQGAPGQEDILNNESAGRFNVYHGLACQDGSFWSTRLEGVYAFPWQCRSFCADHHTCSAFTWDTARSRCYLFNSCETQGFVAGATTGVAVPTALARGDALTGPNEGINAVDNGEDGDRRTMAAAEHTSEVRRTSGAIQAAGVPWVLISFMLYLFMS